MRLTHLLIGKSIAETVLIAVLAIAFFVKAFPPYFKGFAEIEGKALVGWAINSAEPYQRVELQLFVNGNFVAIGVANEFRPDVRAATWAKDDWHGFRFNLAGLQPGKHEARVYAQHSSSGGLRYTLQQLGHPVEFIVDEAGVVTLLSERVGN